MKKHLIFFFSILTLFTASSQVTKETLIADFERAKNLSLAYVEAMPADKFNYRPTADVRTYGEQFLHAAQGTIGLVSNGTGADRIYATTNLEKDESLKSKAEVKRIVTESFEFAIAAIQNMDASTFGEIVESGPFKNH